MWDQNKHQSQNQGNCFRLRAYLQCTAAHTVIFVIREFPYNPAQTINHHQILSTSSGLMSCDETEFLKKYGPHPGSSRMHRKETSFSAAMAASNFNIQHAEELLSLRPAWVTQSILEQSELKYERSCLKQQQKEFCDAQRKGQRWQTLVTQYASHTLHSAKSW